MLTNSPFRLTDDRGFSLIELLVVILIVGILAAIAIPSFLGQQDKGTDAEAKSTVITAAKAMETCATDASGSYTGCTATSLRSIEPTLSDAGPRLSVSSGAQDYEIVVESKRDPGSVTFILTRETNGTIARSCTTGSAGKGGCSAQGSGTW